MVWWLWLYVAIGLTIAIYNQTRIRRETNWLKLKFSEVRTIDFFLSFFIGPIVLVIVIIYTFILFVGLFLTTLYTKINRKSRVDRIFKRKLIELFG